MFLSGDITAEEWRLSLDGTPARSFDTCCSRSDVDEHIKFYGMLHRYQRFG
jgi:hypothetical protein